MLDLSSGFDIGHAGSRLSQSFTGNNIWDCLTRFSIGVYESNNVFSATIFKHWSNVQIASEKQFSLGHTNINRSNNVFLKTEGRSGKSFIPHWRQCISSFKVPSSRHKQRGFPDQHIPHRVVNIYVELALQSSKSLGLICQKGKATRNR